MGILQVRIRFPCSPPGDLPNPGIEPRSPAVQADSLPSEPPGKPHEWVAYSFSKGSSRPRNWTGVSCIAGGFFTSWAKREAHWLSISPTKCYPQEHLFILYYSLLPRLPLIILITTEQKQFLKSKTELHHHIKKKETRVCLNKEIYYRKIQSLITYGCFMFQLGLG